MALNFVRGLIPRNSWVYGDQLCDGIYNIETVFLHQNDVIDHGKEDCHHLPVVVVGPGKAGKTSVIRSLIGEFAIKILHILSGWDDIQRNVALSKSIEIFLQYPQ